MPDNRRPPGAEAAAGFDQVMDELRRNRANADAPATDQQMEVTVRVELSDEAQKFIQVAGVAVDELGT